MTKNKIRREDEFRLRAFQYLRLLHYSVRNATTGSLFAAIRAGTIPEIRVSAKLTTTKTVASTTRNAARLPRFSIKCATIRFIGQVSKSDTPTPISPANKPIRKVSALKIRDISFFLAPRERRTPISLVLSTTET